MNKRLKPFIAGFLAFGIGLGALGCGSKDRTLSPSSEKLTAEDPGRENEINKMGTTQTASDFKESYVNFALQLLRESRAVEETENTMISPLSVMTALEMTRNGARGETEAQMAQVLYGGYDAGKGRQELVSYFRNLPSTENARFQLANSIWFRDDGNRFKVNEDFLKSSSGDYGAEIYRAPFDKTTLSDINRWVDQKTDGMIKKVLEEIKNEDIMFLINAMSFDGEWQNIYEKSEVRKAEFYPEKGKAHKVDMMYSQEGDFMKSDSATGFRKPYKDGYEFVALLPNEEIGIEDYLKSLTGKEYCTLMNQENQVSVNAGLPQFSAETSLELNQVLAGMGMSMAFEGGQADFSGMGTSARGNIFIDQVLHKTYIQVDARGTRAGAVTVVEMKDAAAPMQQESVILNRPFVYAIVDKETRLPIFLGVMENVDGR